MPSEMVGVLADGHQRAALFTSRMSNPDASGLMSYIPEKWSGWIPMLNRDRLGLGAAIFCC